jgi:hypothetical protein
MMCESVCVKERWCVCVKERWCVCVCRLRLPSCRPRPWWSWVSCLPHTFSKTSLSFEHISQSTLNTFFLLVTLMRWYSSNIKPNEIKRQVNKYLKPKNFIKTLQFKQRKAKVYFIFQTQFLFQLTLQKV